MANMDWQTLFSNKRIDSNTTTHTRDEVRGDYMRDYDRVVFSSQFRRLQNKTQVFPLPGAVFVHNRLTHSLEVASVGRSLGKAVGDKIAANYENKFSQNSIDFYRFELSDVIQTACLAHDIGNPPFGHFGEEAIRDFFIKLNNDQNSPFVKSLTENQKNDLMKFEGNANGFRVLTNIFAQSGLKLTHASLAATVKYPCDSSSGFDKKSKILSRKKSGFFDSEIEKYKEIVEELNLIKLSEDQNVYCRHPYVFLVEAADDICYRIIDLEDAFRLNVISINEAIDLLLPFFNNEESKTYIDKKLNEIEDDNQKLSFLRAYLINLLTQQCAEAFLIHEDDILSGTLEKPLIELLDEDFKGLIQKIDAFSVKKIYNHKSVIEKELAGYHVISGLLEEFVAALLSSEAVKSRKVLLLIPNRFKINVSEKSLYENLLTIVDFLSGMTDNYAMELYRKLKGIQTPEMG